MNIKKFLQSRGFTRILYALGILLIVLVIFQAGMFTGYRRAMFLAQMDSNYRRDLHDPRSLFAPFMHGPDEANSHGAVGEIVSVNLPLVMVKGGSTAEEIVMINPGTTIRRFHDTATTSDLRAGEQVVVVGNPDSDGRIQAQFVRILPNLPVTGSASSSSPIKK